MTFVHLTRAAKAPYPPPLTTARVMRIIPNGAKQQKGARGIQITAPIVGWCPGSDYGASSVGDRFCDGCPIVCAISGSLAKFAAIRPRLVFAEQLSR